MHTTRLIGAVIIIVRSNIYFVLDIEMKKATVGRSLGHRSTVGDERTHSPVVTADGYNYPVNSILGK